MNVERPKPCPRPFRPRLPGLAVEGRITGSEVRENPEILGAAAVRPGGHDQSPHAALDLPLESALQLDRRRLVGLRRQDPDRLRLGGDRIKGLLGLAAANLEHRDTLALSLEQAKVKDRGGVDHLLAAQHDNMLEALDVGDRQADVVRFSIGHRGAAMVQVR